MTFRPRAHALQSGRSATRRDQPPARRRWHVGAACRRRTGAPPVIKCIYLRGREGTRGCGPHWSSKWAVWLWVITAAAAWEQKRKMRGEETQRKPTDLSSEHTHTHTHLHPLIHKHLHTHTQPDEAAAPCRLQQHHSRTWWPGPSSEDQHWHQHLTQVIIMLIIQISFRLTVFMSNLFIYLMTLNIKVTSQWNIYFYRMFLWYLKLQTFSFQSFLFIISNITYFLDCLWFLWDIWDLGPQRCFIYFGEIA